MLKYSSILIFLLLILKQGTAPANSIHDNHHNIEIVDFESFEPTLYLENDSIYVINFWATWCAPCVRELPAFEQLYANYKDRKVQVILVSLDNPAHLENRVIPFVERMGLQSRLMLLDDPRSSRWIPLVSDEWSGAIPATVIYSNGYRAFYEKEFKYEELENIILELL